jgi:hypothetical protein
MEQPAPEAYIGVMCTATWIRLGPDSDPNAGYEFRFNRDELRVRGEADGPSRHERRKPDGGPVAFLAPRDTDSGGTWIAVNDRGVSLGLLNGYRRADLVPRDYRSRGLLVADLATCVTTTEIEAALERDDLARYRSFRLLVVAPEPPVFLAEWDGVRLAIDRDAEGRIPFVSSSFEEGDVGRARRAAFDHLVGDPRNATPATLDAFHRSHENGPSAFSVCMHRPEACTRSFTCVRVSPEDVSLAYTAGPPHERTDVVELRLPRRAETGFPRSSERVGSRDANSRERS